MIHFGYTALEMLDEVVCVCVEVVCVCVEFGVRVAPCVRVEFVLVTRHDTRAGD